MAHHGKSVDIRPGSLFGQSENSHAVVRGQLRANLPLLVCGDRVTWRPDPKNQETAIVEGLEPRTNVLSRPRPYRDAKPVASNLDLIILVLSASPAPIGSLADRYLIAAEQMGVDIAIVINKIDLLDSNSESYKPEVANELLELSDIYRQLDYPVYAITTKSGLSAGSDSRQHFGHSLAELLKIIDRRTSILVGQSGVGKSSIINLLKNAEEAAIGEVSAASEKGRHTTTHSSLYLVDNGNREQEQESVDKQHRFAIIDSPGIREFGLWHLEEAEIVRGMREFSQFSLSCEFRDCDHKHSRGCAVQKALQSGEIHPRRASSYKQIIASLEQDN